MSEHESDPGPQRGPASVAQVNAQAKAAHQSLADLLNDFAGHAIVAVSLMPKPIATVHVSRTGQSIKIVLDTSKSTYTEWIPGEGADIGLLRDQETKRLVGAYLPLYAKTLMFGGDGLPDITCNLEDGNANK
jgi:hypothetical protein